MKLTEQGFSNLKYKLKTKSGMFDLYPHQDSWGCWTLGYEADKEKIIEAIRTILTLQENS